MRLLFLSFLISTTLINRRVASRGFSAKTVGTSRSDVASSPQITTRVSMEANIQEKVSMVEGLRESMDLIEELRDYKFMMEREMTVVNGGSSAEVMKQKTERLRHLGWDEERCSMKLHQITWDESALFRSHRHQTQDHLISKKLDNFMKNIAKECDTTNGTLLDVGCGDGILIDYIKSASKDARLESLFGVDISSEMIKIASKKYPQCRFKHADFLSYTTTQKFETVVFSECFHYFNRHRAFKQATDLLSNNGKIIISHPRGMSNVFQQHATNKFLVPFLLPSNSELQELVKEFGLTVLVAPTSSADEPYLSILKKNEE